MVALSAEVDRDHRLTEANVLAKYDIARPVIAAGLYSTCQDSQVSAALCITSFVKDGNIKRAFPPYCQLIERLVELLDSDSWEVVGHVALAIVLLCTSDFSCSGVPPNSAHRANFWKLGAADKVIGLIDRQPLKHCRRERYSKDEALMELCYALAALLQTCEAPGILKLREAPGFFPRAVKLVSSPEREGEAQRMALWCLTIVAQMSHDLAEAIVRAGGREAAEKALKKPFAGPEQARDQETKRRAAELLRALMSVKLEKPSEQALPRGDDVDRLSVKELKALLHRHGVSHQDCFEKADLQRKARVLLAPEATRRAGSTQEAAPKSASGKEKEGVDPPSASSQSSDASSGETEPLGSATLKGLSAKDLRAKLKALNVSTAGCLERQDLVDRLTSALQEQSPPDPDAAPGLEVAPTEESADESTLSAMMEFLGTATNVEARRAAEGMVQQLLRQGELPQDTTLEGGIRLIVRGKSREARRSGLRILEAALSDSSHQLRRDLASAGVLKATVRMLHDEDRTTRFNVLDTLGLFALTPSLAPKIWEYGAMGSILEEFRRPDVLAALRARSPELVAERERPSLQVSLRILANMLIPSSLEGDYVPGSTMRLDPNLPLWDASTRRVGRWVIKNKIHEKAGELLAIVRLSKWRRTRAGNDMHTTPVQATRLLTQLMMALGRTDEVAAIPGVVQSMVYLLEQWETAEMECGNAAIFLVNLHKVQRGALAKFCTRDEMIRICSLLRASLHSPHQSTNFRSQRQQLLACLQKDLRTDDLSYAADSAQVWCANLTRAPNASAAERIVQRILSRGPTGSSLATDEELLKFDFWPTVARHAANAPPERRFLLVTLAEAFNLHPEGEGIPLEPGVKRLWAIAEPHRWRVTLQLLKAGIVRTLEPACHMDETAAHVMSFYRYIAQDVKVGGPLAEALLTDPDLMPFLLRFGLLESGCSLGIALAKLAVKALLRLSPSDAARGTSPGSLFPLTIRPEEDAGRPSDSIRYDYHNGCVYVGKAHAAKAAAVALHFLANGQKLIAEYNEQHPDRPFLSGRLREFEQSGDENQGTATPQKLLKCAVCAEPAAKCKCSRCRKTVYCGKKCQLADWPTHKLTCQPKSG